MNKNIITSDITNIMAIWKLDCGCIQKINDSNPCISNISITYNRSDHITEYKCNNKDDKCNNIEYIQYKKRIIKDKEIKDLSLYKLKIFEETITTIIYEKIPIIYLKEKILDKERYYSRSGLDPSLLNIQKINNRYYCCKNRVDKYIELEIYKYYFISSIKWS